MSKRGTEIGCDLEGARERDGSPLDRSLTVAP